MLVVVPQWSHSLAFPHGRRPLRDSSAQPEFLIQSNRDSPLAAG